MNHEVLLLAFTMLATVNCARVTTVRTTNSTTAKPTTVEYEAPEIEQPTSNTTHKSNTSITVSPTKLTTLEYFHPTPIPTVVSQLQSVYYGPGYPPGQNSYMNMNWASVTTSPTKPYPRPKLANFGPDGVVPRGISIVSPKFHSKFINSATLNVPVHKPPPFVQQKPPPFVQQKPPSLEQQRPFPFVQQKPPPFIQQKPSSPEQQQPLPSVQQKPPSFIQQKPPSFVQQNPLPLLQQNPLPLVQQTTNAKTTDRGLRTTFPKRLPLGNADGMSMRTGEKSNSPVHGENPSYNVMSFNPVIPSKSWQNIQPKTAPSSISGPTWNIQQQNIYQTPDAGMATMAAPSEQTKNVESALVPSKDQSAGSLSMFHSKPLLKTNVSSPKSGTEKSTIASTPSYMTPKWFNGFTTKAPPTPLHTNIWGKPPMPTQFFTMMPTMSTSTPFWLKSTTAPTFAPEQLKRPQNHQSMRNLGGSYIRDPYLAFALEIEKLFQELNTQVSNSPLAKLGLNTAILDSKAQLKSALLDVM